MRWTRRLCIAWVIFVILGLAPANLGFRNATEGVDIYIVSSSVHADVIVPLQHAGIDWRRELDSVKFGTDKRTMTHLAIGWGDKGFFIKTPTWSDLKASTAARAMFWPSSACAHLTLLTRPDDLIGSRRVRLTSDQYLRLCQEIQKVFRRDAQGDIVEIPRAAYGNTDAFVEARGFYHAFNTCNSWVGRVLRRAGVRVPWSSPLPKTVFLYLPPE